jgi:hypothetical protein
VTITKSQPGQRAYGALGEQAEAAGKDASPAAASPLAPKDIAHV